MALLHLMGQSLTHLLVHAIFSTKDRRPFLRSEEIRDEIYAYMAGTLKNLDCHPIKIGGVEDHVHVFSSLSKNIAFSDLIGRLKGASSKRLKEKGLHGFGWQNGYGAFSVSESNVESVTAYISTRQNIIRNLATRKRFVKFSNATGSPSTNAMFGIETLKGRTPLQGASLDVTFTQG
jgi:REP element-mobilizing transposase RayT